MGLEPQKILCECLHGEPLHFRYSMRSFMNSTSYALKKNPSFCVHFFLHCTLKEKKKPLFNVCLLSVLGSHYGLYS